jgi:hypothetical protein
MEQITLVNWRTRQSPPEADSKTCSGPCGTRKPLEEFPRQTEMPDGRAPVCKACKNAKQNQVKQEKKKELSAFAFF